MIALLRRRPPTVAIALVLALPLCVWAVEAWPPMLPPRSTQPAAMAADIERIWSSPTVKRQVEGDRAQAPLEVYVALIDTPEIATAAARHLQLARYDVKRLGADRFQVDDGSGSQGEYQVLARDRGRRVMFSRGRHTGRVVGTITGIALTDLQFETRDGQVTQRLTAWVIIENRFLAVVARVLVPLFGRVADRKLTEGFRVTARVAEWAATRPAEFCEWLDRQPFPPETVKTVRTPVRACPPKR